MFDIGATELLLIAIVALLVIGPRDLPRVMRTVGNWVGKARATTKHFRIGLDAMMREADLAEEQKKWAAENDRIMREHPAPVADAPAAPPVADKPVIDKPVIDKPAPAKPTPAKPAAGMPPDSAEPDFSFGPATDVKGPVR
ncbi:MAG: twin-arginine translocase subunit TatB [Sphingomonadaceae bacterium]|nr:twin-arginine translocase subunit TatB [Sphingomonadaceae bacterium]